MFEQWMDVDLQKMPVIRQMSGNLYSGDALANKIGVRVTNGGESVTLSGTVKAYVIKADGATVEVTGSKSGNTAWVVLPSSVYNVVGFCGVYLKIIDGSSITTLGGIEGNVYKAS